MGEGVTAKRQKRVWTIDVCKTCGRHAIWPFCDHKPKVMSLQSGESWTELVRVREC